MRRLLIILVVGLFPFLQLWASPGRLHPDEVFQALEPAQRLAFGFGVKAWEWDVGLRNWAVPGIFAGLLKASSAVGVDDVLARRAVLALPQLGLHLAFLLAVYRVARRRLEEAPALLAVVLVGANPLVVYFGARTLSESFSAAFLAIALERLDAIGEAPVRRTAFTAGVLLGLAELTRYGTAPFIIAALIAVAVLRGREALLWCVLGGLPVALALGLLDLFTWGQSLPKPWLGGFAHSFFEYVNFNIILGKSAGFGRSPWWYYLPFIPFPALLGLWAWRRTPALRAWLFIGPPVLYLVSLSTVPHKEYRFLMPALVVLLVSAAPACAAVCGRLWQGAGARRVFGPAVALALLACPWALTPAEAVPVRPELTQLTMRANREGSGVLIINEGVWGTGGSFFAGGTNLLLRDADPSPTADRLWCTADVPQDECFVKALATPGIRRAIFLDPFDPERTRVTLAALEGGGFRVVRRVGDATWLER